jgi:hypothetical protein
MLEFMILYDEICDLASLGFEEKSRKHKTVIIKNQKKQIS